MKKIVLMLFVLSLFKVQVIKAQEKEKEPRFSLYAGPNATIFENYGRSVQRFYGYQVGAAYRLNKFFSLGFEINHRFNSDDRVVVYPNSSRLAVNRSLLMFNPYIQFHVQNFYLQASPGFTIFREKYSSLLENYPGSVSSPIRIMPVLEAGYRIDLKNKHFLQPNLSLSQRGDTYYGLGVKYGLGL